MRKIPCNYIQARRPTDLEKNTTESDNSSPETSQELITLSEARSRSSSEDTDEDPSAWAIIRNPSPVVTYVAGGLSMTDLRLVHHWSTSTFSSLLVGQPADATAILQRVVPELAFQNEFLMHGLLGTASLHMQHLGADPAQYRKRTYTYRARAFSEFRQSLNNVAPDSESYDAMLMMSVLLVVLCSQDYLEGEDEITILHWLILYGGLSAIIDMKYPEPVNETSISPVLRRKFTELTITPIVPTILLNMMQAVDPTDPDYNDREVYCAILDQLGMLYASLCQDGLGPALYIRVITFCSCPSDQFILFARKKRPRALVILTYYLCFLKLVTGVWWVEGIADRDIQVIARTIPPKWLTFMEVPLMVHKMTDHQEIANFLLQ